MPENIKKIPGSRGTIVCGNNKSVEEVETLERTLSHSVKTVLENWFRSHRILLGEHSFYEYFDIKISNGFNPLSHSSCLGTYFIRTIHITLGNFTG